MSRKNYQSLSDKYRKNKLDKQLIKSEIDSYLAARMPATRAAVCSVLEEVAQRIAHPIHSLLDMGAGPGTGLLAAREIFQEIERAVLVEKNIFMVEKGKELVDATWVVKDFDHYEPIESDLALFSYSLGELDDFEGVLEKVWQKVKTVVVIEPGTPTGFSVILRARKALIGWGGYLLAPCPHQNKCPMEGSDWCHFSVRLERTKEHMRAKGAQLGYEDEKYSYVVFTKERAERAQGRIVRHPIKRPGHVLLTICGQEGLYEKTVTKKDKELYKHARKIKWGSECV